MKGNEDSFRFFREPVAAVNRRNGLSTMGFPEHGGGKPDAGFCASAIKPLRASRVTGNEAFSPDFFPGKSE